MVGRIAHIVVFAALTTCGGNVVQGTDGVDARAASGKDATARVNSGTRRDATSDGSQREASARDVAAPAVDARDAGPDAGFDAACRLSSGEIDECCAQGHPCTTPGIDCCEPVNYDEAGVWACFQCGMK